MGNVKLNSKGNPIACDNPMEVYSRIVGYFRPVSNWNKGKKEEYKDRVTYDIYK